MESGRPDPKQRPAIERKAGATDNPRPAYHAAEPGVGELAQRLAQAERELRATRRLTTAVLGMSMVAVVGAGVLAAQRWTGVQETSSTVKVPFRIVDAQGKSLLQVDSNQEGPQLRMMDADGALVASLGATQEGGTLRVASRVGKGNLLLYSNADGGQIAVSGREKEKPLVWLGARQEGGGLGIYDRAGQPCAWLTINKENRGLSIADASGRPYAWVGAAKKGGGLAIYNRSGKTAGWLTASKKGAGLAVYDQAGNCLSDLAHRPASRGCPTCDQIGTPIARQIHRDRSDQLAYFDVGQKSENAGEWLGHPAGSKTTETTERAPTSARPSRNQVPSVRPPTKLASAINESESPQLSKLASSTARARPLPPPLPAAASSETAAGADRDDRPRGPKTKVPETLTLGSADVLGGTPLDAVGRGAGPAAHKPITASETKGSKQVLPTSSYRGQAVAILPPTEGPTASTTQKRETRRDSVRGIYRSKNRRVSAAGRRHRQRYYRSNRSTRRVASAAKRQRYVSRRYRQGSRRYVWKTVGGQRYAYRWCGRHWHRCSWYQARRYGQHRTWHQARRPGRSPAARRTRRIAARPEDRLQTRPPRAGRNGRSLRTAQAKAHPRTKAPSDAVPQNPQPALPPAASSAHGEVTLPGNTSQPAENPKRP